MTKKKSDSVFINDFYTFIQNNKYELDKRQLDLINILNEYKTHLELVAQNNKFIAKIKGFFKGKNAENKLKKGMYIWGDVGGGKSMIASFFYEKLLVSSKARFHFHEFMLHIHALFEQKRQQKIKNPFLKMCEEIAANKVIVLDEIFVNNVADAMILERLFKTLIKMRVFVIFTSNRPPQNLYLDGLQRERFKPFIELVESSMLVYKLSNQEDYRMRALKNLNTSYFYPLNNAANVFINETIKGLIGHDKLSATEIQTETGRTLKIMNAYGHVACFDFSELCGIPMSASDYLALTHHFKVIFLSNLPVFTEENREDAMRFITLIDCLYDTRTQLICTAQEAPENLYKGGRNAFEFQRTISRLKEMQSSQYLNDNHEDYIECSD